jgi:hypothetical protein
MSRLIYLRLSCHVPADRSWLSWFDYPVLLSSPGCPVLVVLSGVPVLAIQSWLSCSGCPILDDLSCLLCPGCPVMIFLPYLNFLGCPILFFLPRRSFWAVLYRQSGRDCPFWLRCHAVRFLCSVMIVRWRLYNPGGIQIPGPIISLLSLSPTLSLFFLYT